MEYRFELAAPEDVETVFRLYEQRISWMNEKNIRQWNTTGYLDAYPISYYREQQRRGNLYVLRGEDCLAGAVVLLTEDERWADRAAEPAYYVHNLVTSPAVPGAGRRILEEIEKLGMDTGKCALRLDCAVDNAFLNAYYESGGYLPCGRCQDGSYCGNRREKRLSGTSDRTYLQQGNELEIKEIAVEQPSSSK